MKKIILTLLALVTLLVSMTIIPAQAAIPTYESTVLPRWVNTANITLQIDYNQNGYGYANATVFGVVGVTKITTNIKVYRQQGALWKLVAENESTINSMNGLFSCQFPLISGSEYRADYIITVRKNNTDEIIEHTIYRSYT